MRPPAKMQDPARTPLNEILGSEGDVRILRVLSFSRESIGRTAVARRAQLNPSGVRRSLDRLAEFGIIEIIGCGRNIAVRLRDQHPLAAPLRSLFHAEQMVFDGIVDSAREAFSQRSLIADAIWLENSSSRSPGTVDVGVLAPPENIDEAVRIVEEHFKSFEKGHAIHFIVHGYTEADLLAETVEQAAHLEDITLLAGWIPYFMRTEEGGPIRTHRDVDQRARAFAEKIARLLTNDPSIIERALRWIDARLTSADDRLVHELDEWRRILNELSIRQIQSLLREDSERADRLRQSLPFIEALTETERRELLKEESR